MHWRYKRFSRLTEFPDQVQNRYIAHYLSQTEKFLCQYQFLKIKPMLEREVRGKAAKPAAYHIATKRWTLDFTSHTSRSISWQRDVYTACLGAHSTLFRNHKIKKNGYQLTHKIKLLYRKDRQERSSQHQNCNLQLAQNLKSYPGTCLTSRRHTLQYKRALLRSPASK